MRRHLEQIDRSDPNMTFAMTAYLYNKAASLMSRPFDGRTMPPKIASGGKVAQTIPSNLTLLKSGRRNCLTNLDRRRTHLHRRTLSWKPKTMPLEKEDGPKTMPENGLTMPEQPDNPPKPPLTCASLVAGGADLCMAR